MIKAYHLGMNHGLHKTKANVKAQMLSSIDLAQFRCNNKLEVQHDAQWRGFK